MVVRCCSYSIGGMLVDGDEAIVTPATIAADSVCVFGAPVVAFLSHMNNIASILRPAFADSQQLWWCYAEGFR